MMTVSFPEFPGRTGLSRPAGAGPQRGAYPRFFKRLLDVTAILLAAPVVGLAVGILALLIAGNGGNPFYSQFRVGRGGKPFRMWKLRSMVNDADARLADYLADNPEARTEWETMQKLANDPRITPLGQFLRRSSLDELPQLWNVLRGDMSLVGPRPMMLNQQAIYPGTAYFNLRPGLTGYWQTAERNKTTFESRAGFDTAYEADLSLMTDLRILCRTVLVVLRGTGV